MRKVPYVRKGTKAEKKPPIRYRRIIYDQIQDQMAASAIELKVCVWYDLEYSFDHPSPEYIVQLISTVLQKIELTLTHLISKPKLNFSLLMETGYPVNILRK